MFPEKYLTSLLLFIFTISPQIIGFLQMEESNEFNGTSSLFIRPKTNNNEKEEGSVGGGKQIPVKNSKSKKPNVNDQKKMGTISPLVCNFSPRNAVCDPEGVLTDAERADLNQNLRNFTASTRSVRQTNFTTELCVYKILANGKQWLCPRRTRRKRCVLQELLTDVRNCCSNNKLRGLPKLNTYL